MATMSKDLLLPHQKDTLVGAIEEAPTSQLAGNGSHILPQIISDVKRAYRGYRIHSEAGGWKFYAAECLSEAQVSDLEDWLIDREPDRKRAA